ncbi:CBS domain-containing protein [Halogeometricum borinquense]|uniref:CBS domain-containing protein n=1 Tax=Halogeometricum borinquense TaxID=60847 RepID=A0A482SYM0_9EURY|nr:CBS domain-containing protein [Halogeometricum borinquense]
MTTDLIVRGLKVVSVCRGTISEQEEDGAPEESAADNAGRRIYVAREQDGVAQVRKTRTGSNGGLDPAIGVLSTTPSASNASDTVALTMNKNEGANALNIPVRNLMSDAVATVERSAPLDEVVETMFEREISSLVVTADDTDEPNGIVTKTDVIEALTWERDDRNAVQVFGLDLLEGMDCDDVSALIENMASKYGEMSVIKASIQLQEHKEQSRGVPLVLARIRLVTDRGYFTADGEGYGASHALRLAANAVERQLLKGKTYGKSKKHPDTDEQEQLYGWWLGG